MAPSNRKLSERQTKMLEYITDFVKEHPYPPSVREIQLGCSISSTSVVDYNLHILRREGYIKRSPDISRGIQLLDKDTGRAMGLQTSIAVPVFGAIAAGEPLMAFPEASEAEETLELPASMLPPRTDGMYALRVKGQSMIEDLIDDGDVVLFQRRESASPGEMVAAWLKERGEATLKRYYPEGARVRLQPANSAMSPIYEDADKVEVQGVVVGVIRMYR
ncbi:MAG: transcriptional repressor LexA [Chloroflexota bacterium]|nr:transcriptional repressor LexA [Chloroflexota bacterium]MDE2970131.1 transcriptional repressor LexA [Chloroflexota bacterium]